MLPRLSTIGILQKISDNDFLAVTVKNTTNQIVKNFQKKQRDYMLNSQGLKHFLLVKYQ